MKNSKEAQVLIDRYQNNEKKIRQLMSDLFCLQQEIASDAIDERHSGGKFTAQSSPYHIAVKVEIFRRG